MSLPLVALRRNVHISFAQPLASNDAYTALHGCLTCFSQLVFVDMDGNFGILSCFSHIQLYWGVWLTSALEEQNLSPRLDLHGNNTGKICNHAVICAFYSCFVLGSHTSLFCCPFFLISSCSFSESNKSKSFG